jgi:hypothetical protein
MQSNFSNLWGLMPPTPHSPFPPPSRRSRLGTAGRKYRFLPLPFAAKPPWDCGTQVPLSPPPSRRSRLGTAVGHLPLFPPPSRRKAPLWDCGRAPAAFSPFPERKYPSSVSCRKISPPHKTGCGEGHYAQSPLPIPHSPLPNPHSPIPLPIPACLHCHCLTIAHFRLHTIWLFLEDPMANYFNLRAPPVHDFLLCFFAVLDVCHGG